MKQMDISNINKMCILYIYYCIYNYNKTRQHSIFMFSNRILATLLNKSINNDKDR